MLEKIPLNLTLMKNPINWAIVTAMALIGAMLLDILTTEKTNNG